MPQAANGHGRAHIVAFEDEEDLNVDDDDDSIPGPPVTHRRSGSGTNIMESSGGGVSRSRGSMLISRVLNLSSGKRSSATATTTTRTDADTLQLSKSDHHEYVAGSGILASREDLNMAPEACTFSIDVCGFDESSVCVWLRDSILVNVCVNVSTQPH